jgi:hypothetical protein
MTRQHILAAILDRISEYKGDPMSGSPMQLNDIITNSANQVAKLLKTDYGVCPINIVANQALYLSPTSVPLGQAILNKKVALTIYDVNGYPHTLNPVKPQTMDSRLPGWRSAPASALPKLYVVLGISSFALWPVPNFSATASAGPPPAGMFMEGAILPGLSWASPTAECPLPTDLHDLVVLKGCIMRCEQNPTDWNMRRLKGFEKEYREQMQQAYQDRIGDNSAANLPAYADEYSSWWDGGFGNTAVVNPLIGF